MILGLISQAQRGLGHALDALDLAATPPPTMA